MLGQRCIETVDIPGLSNLPFEPTKEKF
jgi:hypothetical protein